MNIYLLNYNNYYNRICKKEDTLTDYLEYQVGDTIQGVNFNPNDGVNTELIVNTNQRANYLLAVEDNIINSRWFIIESTRLRNGQHKLMLRRDLIADNYNDIVNAPCFIEKATLNDSDPAIFNSENMTFNQIKTSETELKDETGSAWIVGYITSKTKTESGDPLEMEAIFNAAVGADEVVSSIENYKYYQYSNLATQRQDLAGYPSVIAYCVYARDTATISDVHKVCFNKNGGQLCGAVQHAAGWDPTDRVGYDSTITSYAKAWNPTCENTSLVLQNYSPYRNIDDWVEAFNNYFTTLDSQVNSYIPIKSEEETSKLNNENGKIIYDSTAKKYYQVSIAKQDNEWAETIIPSGSMFNTLSEAYTNRQSIYDNEHTPGAWKSNVVNGTPNSSTFAIRTYGAKYDVTLTELAGYGGDSYKITIGSDRYHLNDAPYDMFAIPYSDNLDILKNGTKLFTSNKLLAFQAVMALVRKYQAAGYIYDVQLLPYCPVRSMIKAGGSFDIGDNVVNYITATVNGSTTNIGIVIYASNSSDTFNIPANITYNNKKLSTMCDMYRLCSPNYNGQFEFNAAMNNGINYFNVDFTYKPYNPYIHINPNFNGLYGQDFNDSRGLICGGEFSLPAISNAWDTYELQNKNYQNMFNREIQNMQVTHKYQMIQGGIQSIAGVAQGAVSGAALGGVGGAIAGGVASLAGGIADQVMNQKLYNEALDYKQDLYGMQLGNIKALPYTLTKTTAFTYNNKIFPILEYYTCTEQEKQAAANKIAYNGMTVGRIGTINDYKNNNWSYGDINSKGYIKGKLIRLETIEDTNYLNEIASEIYKGVFIK